MQYTWQLALVLVLETLGLMLLHTVYMYVYRI